jgi:hypothetical protein
MLTKGRRVALATALIAAIAPSAFVGSSDSDATSVYHVTTEAPGSKNTVKFDLQGIKNGASIDSVQVWNGTSPEPTTNQEWEDSADVEEVQFSTSNPPPDGHVHNINSGISNAKLRFSAAVDQGGKVRVCISQSGGGNVTSQGDTWSQTN